MLDAANGKVGTLQKSKDKLTTEIKELTRNTTLVTRQIGK